MKTRAIAGLALVAVCAGLSGCVSNQKPKAVETAYAPQSERVLSASEYWFLRDQEDLREVARARQLGQD